jgi:hypothetical protein
MVLAGFVTLSCTDRTSEQGKLASKSDSDQVLTVVSNAIRAHGIPTNLAAIKGGRMKVFTHGTPGMGYEDKITEEVVFWMPAKLRRVTTFTTEFTDGRKESVRRVSVQNGLKAWDKNEDGSVTRAAQMNDPRRLFPLSHLFDIGTFEDPRFSITLVPAQEDHATCTVHFTIGGQWFTDVVFDQASMLVAGTSKPFYDPLTKRSAVAETRLSDYRRVRGMMIPMSTSTFLDGRKFTETKCLEFELLDELSDSEFTEPKPGW